MTEVVPAILEKEFAEIDKKIALVSPFVSWVQIDIADGILVPNTTFNDPFPFAKFTNINLEVHMMVKDPMKYVKGYIENGFKRLISHIEGEHVEEFITACEESDVEVGLAVDAKTPITSLKPYIEDIDTILVMGVNAGFSGQKFIEETVEKVRWVTDRFFDLPVSVDGAMDLTNAQKVVKAGAKRINSNSYIFKSSDVKIAIEKLKALDGT